MNFPKQYIAAGEEFATWEKPVPAPCFRRSFFVKNGLRSAELLITGLGFYDASLNGKNFTKGFLAPYRSNLDDYIYFDRYDLTCLLSEGENVLGVIVGNGLRNSTGGYIWDFDKAKFRGAPLTAFSLTLLYEDGSEETVVSDFQTRTAPSPILFDDLHFGEYYDARLEMPGWDLPGFDDSRWTSALVTQPPRGEERLCEAEPIVVKDTISPVSVTKISEGYVYDFGVNHAGIGQLKIKGEAGQRIVLRYFETYRDGKPYFRNNRFFDKDRYQEDEYTCSGNGEETHVARFTYHGYRYVLVSGITDEQAEPSLLTSLVLYSDIGVAGSFRCSDETVNRIQEITMRSNYSNFHYFPTDCPQREKNGWTADAALSAEQMLFNLRPENSYREWLRNIQKALTDEGKLPGIIPTSGWGYHWGNGPAWDCILIYLPYFTYRYRGDKRILDGFAPPMMRYLQYLFSRLDENGIMEIGLGDWCEVGTDKEDNFSTPLAVTDTILTSDIAQKAAFLFDVLKMEEQKQFALSLAAKTKNAFRSRLWDPKTGTVKGMTQTGQAMALYYDMLEETEKESAFSLLMQLIEKDGFFKVGVLGGRVLFRVLAENGQAPLAYHMITKPDFPSYGNWVERGYTSLCEAFEPADGRVLSLNHHFWGDVSAWFYTYLAGLRINPTGFDPDHIDLKPCFLENLSSVSASFDAHGGKIAVEIRNSENTVTISVEAADSLHGVIALPAGFVFEDGTNEKTLSSGNFIAKKKLSSLS